MAEDSVEDIKTKKRKLGCADDFAWVSWGEVHKELKVPELSIYTGPSARICKDVVAFDVDGTIIKTKSGEVFPKDLSDWQFWDPSVKKRLTEIWESGKKIVFFTNQGGVEKSKEELSNLQTKFEKIVQDLGIPIQILLCTGINPYRKPSILVWEHFETFCNTGLAVNKASSMYIGDAAGRIKDWAPQKKKGLFRHRSDVCR